MSLAAAALPTSDRDRVPRDLALVRLPALRRAKGVSLRVLSARCGLAPSWLSVIERGFRATTDEARRIASALDCRTDELLEENN